jgi:hypothetical protein
MAGAKQRRRKKHRGTQGGTVRRRGRTSRPGSRVEARDVARQRRQNRFDRPPSWRSAFNRAILAAGVFFALLVIVLKQKFAPSLSLALVMLAIYVPLGFAMDKALHRIRQRRKERQTGA